MRRILIALLITGMSAFLINCSKPDDTALGYWDNAVVLFNQSDYPGCIKQYQKIIKYFPDDSLAVPAMFAMAEVYKNNLNDANEAIKIYKKIMLEYKNSEQVANAHFMIGYVYANEIKDLKQAEKYYKSFLQKYPNHILAPSAEWELQNLGKDLDEIPELQKITQENQPAE
ncbi:MAG TPA: tetratricopeptide repeat protein [Candidatus Marinimicrobia bacterium]|nr:tetratricopeptide repeat protein [Candidatus Neomarinimicrobiota bacterium]HRU92372.1 tetratricopeptide repeat protein [Candidatus Neomarinimicrobiota bacterium]